MEIDTSNSEKGEQKPVRGVRNEYVEQIRAIILEALEKGMKKREIGKLAGVNGQYVSMILNYAFFPKRAEFQNKLLKRFQNVRNAIPNKSKGDARHDD